jgi:hypothetical protein
VLGDSTLESLTPSVNAPFFIIIYSGTYPKIYESIFQIVIKKNHRYVIEGQGPGIGREAKTAKNHRQRCAVCTENFLGSSVVTQVPRRNFGNALIDVSRGGEETCDGLDSRQASISCPIDEASL